ncbi:hypothetical protein HAX54_040621, partial [Datura stramonium]|nr:hypothetical protein [Datura stramonium]
AFEGEKIMEDFQFEVSGQGAYFHESNTRKRANERGALPLAFAHLLLSGLAPSN